MQIEGLTLGAVVLLLLKEIVNSFSHTRKKHIEALEQNTHAIIELKIKLENLEKSLDKIPKIEQDVNAAHTKLREIKTKIEGSLS